MMAGLTHRRIVQHLLSLLDGELLAETAAVATAAP
jgi:hypothetical protein